MMETNKLKNLWQEQDLKISKSIALNERLLKNTFKQKTNGIIEGLLRWNYFSLIEFIVFLIFMGISTYKFMNDWRFLVSGIIINSFLIGCIVSSIFSIKKLYTIDLDKSSIVTTKQMFLRYKKQENRNFRVLLFTFPPVIITFLLLGVNFVRNINLFDYPIFLIILSSSILLISYPIAFISYRLICLRKYNQIENNLVELEEFIND